MQLNVQVSGSGEPLLIIHGLFGTLENWGSQIKALAEHFTVYALDLRNHGRSPHSDQVSYPAMANDVIELMDQYHLNSAHILGHSMGGKVAMQLAMNHPHRVKKLIVVDIAPVQYPRHHNDVFAGLNRVDLATLKSRSEADQLLALDIPETGVRQFLLKNLYRNEAKQFAWRMNIPALESGYNEISKPPSGPAYLQPMLFIKGENSDYITTDYRDEILRLFPKAGYRIIKQAGHWPHAEQAAAFTKQVLNHLLR